MEWRRGQSIFTVILFTTLLILIVGLLSWRARLSEQPLRLFFWVSYLFTIFQALPRAILDRRPEEWRWLHQLFSPEGNAAGIWLYANMLSVAVGAYLMIGAQLMWGYKVSFLPNLLGGAVLSVPLAFAAFITARAEASYALTSVLAFPLVIFPLIWVSSRSDFALSPMVALLGVESLLFLFILPAVWRD